MQKGCIILILFHSLSYGMEWDVKKQKVDEN